MPEFSVVIPVHNRERYVGRAIRSCLAQQQADFEVIVVDDGSTDASTDTVSVFQDRRIRLIRHGTNRGVVAARSTGVDAAIGDWIVMLDSDDELLPGALSRMSQLAVQQGSAAERLAFMYRRSDGRLSPFPPFRDELLSYAGYLRCLEGQVLFDFLSCTRRLTYRSVRWREWKLAGIILYQLDFSSIFRTFCSSEILGVVHTDAPNRLSWRRREPDLARQAGVELGEEMDLILARHGGALRQFAPQTLQKFLRVRASYHFLAGSAARGVRQSLRCLRASPLSVETWSQLLVGLAGPNLFARARSLRPPPT